MGGDQYIVEGLRGRSQWPPATPCYAYGAKNLRLDQRDAYQAGLDHFAMVPATLAHDDARASALQALLRSGNAYIKLSAPYRLACAGMQGDDAARTWAAAFLRAAPRHVLWGSDWPHTAREPGKAAHDVSAYRTLPEGTLARSLRDWLPTARFRQQVLVENPARLYAF
ncbi:amidohydrolase family protein [Cupriavidus sp. CuC1]|uniref:amidohydrolase family protein n=1 Tax=Cupriavidus sp. CuC1 TaxID=3373131 RepID=UPI0037D034C5